MSSNNTSTTGQDFYVGYLPVPRAHKRFLAVLVPILIIGMVGIGSLVAITQRSPGYTDVVSSQISTWQGTVYSNPYPMLVHDDGSIHLLIGIGKFGVADRVLPFEGQRCTVDGWGLARSDRRAIQIDLAEDAIKAVDGHVSTVPVTNPSSLERVELIGEIVDGKCFLGAMKPGDGKAHKACATLCIRGGLPPMFVSNKPMSQLPLVLVDGSTELPKSILGLVGEPVRISGEMSKFGTLSVLNLDSEDIHRWSGDAP
jgi:hypothetical protein